jgi:hypothetical protein
MIASSIRNQIWQATSEWTKRKQGRQSPSGALHCEGLGMDMMSAQAMVRGALLGALMRAQPRTHTHTHTNTHTHTHTHIQTQTNKQTNTHTHIDTRTNVYSKGQAVLGLAQVGRGGGGCHAAVIKAAAAPDVNGFGWLQRISTCGCTCVLWERWRG